MLKGRSLMNIYQLAEEGLGYRETARLTGHSRNTVRKYLRDGVKYGSTSRKSRGSKLDPYKDTVSELVESGLTSTPAIMERIVPLGYSGKETTLRNFIRSIRPPRSVQVAVRRYETKPGEQLQFDWGILPFVNKDGKNANLPCFVATLSYSRRRYIRFADSMDIYGLITCVIEAFRYFGGLTNAVLRDHMKTVVIGAIQKGGWNYNQQFLDLCRYLGVSIRLCQPRRAQTKGKVERSIRYVKENFWPGREFENLVDVNTQAIAWCKDRDQIRHATTGMKPIDMFLKHEAVTLREMPSIEELEPFMTRERKVSHDGFVSFGGTFYGVPFRYAGSVVTALPKDGSLIVYGKDNEVIAIHELKFKSRETVYLLHQYAKMTAETARIEPLGRAFEVPAMDIEKRPLEAYVEVM